MTVSYSTEIATASHLTFLRLLFKWRGSVYRVIWVELLLFACVYTVLSLLYRFLLTEPMRRQFEYICLYCDRLGERLPVGFVLGFYVNLIVARWWDQFLAIPWPDTVATTITAFCHGTSERARMMRRTLVRYVNLSFCLTTRDISSRARFRFPTEEHLVTAGIITEKELEIFRSTAPKGMHPLYFAPVVWATEIAAQMRREGIIQSDRAMEIISRQLNAFRGSLGMLLCYDWINPPLVYTQIATVTVYTYFLSSLFGWQFLDPNQHYQENVIDIYVPVFGLLRFIFYMGWLKVAESLINPFGDDQDDFEIEEMIERNLQVSYMTVDTLFTEVPPLVKDPYWDLEDMSLQKPNCSWPNELSKSTEEEGTDDMLLGSLANVDFTDGKPTIGRRLSKIGRNLLT